MKNLTDKAITLLKLRISLCNLLLIKAQEKLESKDENEVKLFGLLFSYSYLKLKFFPELETLTSEEIDVAYAALVEIKAAIENNCIDMGKFKTAITIYQTLTNQRQLITHC